MAEDLQLVGQIFGDRELVASLSAFQRQVRQRIFGGLKALGRQFAEDVATAGLAEQGIKNRSGRLARSMVVRGSLGAASARVLVYPGATDPKTKYRYPWALGKGSPKNETTVREYLRGVPAGARAPKARGKLGRAAVYSARASAALVRAGATRVKAHHRKVRLKPRPFMSGSALTRLQAAFGQRMEDTILAAIADAQRIQAAELGGEGYGGA